MVFAKKIPGHAKEAVLVVTHYDAGNLSGWLFHPHLASPLNIKSFPQMAMLLDALLDLEKCPGCPVPMVKLLYPDKDILAALKIQVLFRENHTWQGRLIWLETGEEKTFRSVLELIGIFDGILADCSGCSRSAAE